MRLKAPRPKEVRPAAEPPAMFYRIHALLHTMHAIERYEDQLCALMHEIQTAGTVSPIVSEELRELLADIPSAEYKDNLDGIREALDLPAPKPVTRRRSAKQVKKSAPKEKATPKKKAAAKKTVTSKAITKKSAAPRKVVAKKKR